MSDLWVTGGAVASLVTAAVCITLAVSKAAWKDPGRCDRVVGSQSSITAGNVRELTVTCLVERSGP